AFKSLVDAVGGVNITIENSFFDYWHKISFPAGTEHMNGERALAYVRARYVEGPEGGDFRRGARQQQVLLALREKIFSVNTALDFGTLTSILNSLSDDIRTDMELWEMKRFFELSRLINPKEVKSVVLDTGHNGVLVGGTELLGDAPAAVLRPRTGDYSEIQAIAANIFSDEVGTNITATPASELQETPASDTAQPESAEAPEEELPILEIRNGTNITGLAKQTSDSFEEDGYTVAAIGNAATRDRQETVVYALKTSASDGAQQVAEILEAEADTGLPEGEAESSADVLIILGTDADKS
ncbi:MAG: LCP family protein, partial [Candidatus Binatia bacterium]